jgi:DNA-binding CsgD family transcriptional regulator
MRRSNATWQGSGTKVIQPTVRPTSEETEVVRPISSVDFPGGAAAALLEAASLHAVFDEIDYGMLILNSDGDVLYANRAACAELEARDPLRMVGGALRSRRDQEAAPLRGALRGACRHGLRASITVGEGARRISAAIVPIAGSVDGRDSLALITLGRREIASEFALDGFARSHALTRTEVRVLVALSQGMLPAEMAASFGVTLSTVRSHIVSIRQKTGAESFIGLIRQLAVLPPMVFSTLPANTTGYLPVRDALPNRRSLQPLLLVAGAT